MLTERDLQALEAQQMEALADGWCLLNTWRWPAWLPDPEEPDFQSKDDRRGDALFWIIDKIGYKECLRAWNKEKMTHDEFEAFWDQVKPKKQNFRNN